MCARDRDRENCPESGRWRQWPNLDAAAADAVNPRVKHTRTGATLQFDKKKRGSQVSTSLSSSGSKTKKKSTSKAKQHTNKTKTTTTTTLTTTTTTTSDTDDNVLVPGGHNHLSPLVDTALFSSAAAAAAAECNKNHKWAKCGKSERNGSGEEEERRRAAAAPAKRNRRR